MKRLDLAIFLLFSLGVLASASGGAQPITSSVPFIGLTPCRIVDTRGPAGPYGAPSLSASVPRDFVLVGQCVIPSGARAVSLNITVTNTQGPGFISIYPQGAPAPLVSTLNYAAGQTLANAAVVPLGASGGVTVVAGVSGTDLIIDTNGYYGGGVGINNTFLGLNAGNFTMSGFGGNTAVGASALSSDSVGFENTAIGSGALQTNTSGTNNTATGGGALFSNDTGGANTAGGVGALGNNIGGGFNTALGVFALGNNTSGNHNTALGKDAGMNLTTGDYNIDIGNPGIAGEATTIRIGTQGTQTTTFIAGISGATVVGSTVVINASGQLGVAGISSGRFKDDIRDIGEESGRLLKLRPVSFRYKPELDPAGLEQYGLVAEEVAKVYPDLVVSDQEGKPQTVRYDLISTLLLNEVQKQRRIIEELESRLARVEAMMAEPQP